MIIMTEEKLIQQIERGDFKDYYLAYPRRSTDDEDNQKNSISFQKDGIFKLAIKDEIKIAPITIKGFCTEGVVTERHSGFKQSENFTVQKNGKVVIQIERPKFQRMMHYLSKGYFKGVICLSWDRLSRNETDNVIIGNLMKQGVDFRFVFTKYEDSASGALYMGIDGLFAVHYSRVVKERVTIGIHKARNNGKCTYRAPIGYLNQKGVDYKHFDPKRAEKVKQLFELYATGNYSLSDLARYAADQGLTTVPMRRKRTTEEMNEDEVVKLPKITRPLTVTHISKILRNQFYLGRTLGNYGEYVPSISHKALISQQLFDKVQRLLKKKYVSVYYEKKNDLLLRGLLRCWECNRAYTPYVKKRHLYLRAKCNKKCANTCRNIRDEKLFGIIAHTIRNLYLGTLQRKQLNRASDQKLEVLKLDFEKSKLKAKQRRQKVQRDLDYLTSNKLELLSTGTYDAEGYANELKKLNEKITELDEKLSVNVDTYAESSKTADNLGELLESLMYYYQMAIPAKKELIIKTLFGELFISDMTLKYSLNSEFFVLNERALSFGDPKGSYGELLMQSEQLKKMKKGLALIEKLMDDLKE